VRVAAGNEGNLRRRKDLGGRKPGHNAFSDDSAIRYTPEKRDLGGGLLQKPALSLQATLILLYWDLLQTSFLAQGLNPFLILVAFDLASHTG